MPNNENVIQTLIDVSNDESLRITVPQYRQILVIFKMPAQILFDTKTGVHYKTKSAITAALQQKKPAPRIDPWLLCSMNREVQTLKQKPPSQDPDMFADDNAYADMQHTASSVQKKDILRDVGANPAFQYFHAKALKKVKNNREKIGNTVGKVASRASDEGRRQRSRLATKSSVVARQAAVTARQNPAMAGKLGVIAMIVGIAAMKYQTASRKQKAKKMDRLHSILQAQHETDALASSTATVPFKAGSKLATLFEQSNNNVDTLRRLLLEKYSTLSAKCLVRTDGEVRDSAAEIGRAVQKYFVEKNKRLTLMSKFTKKGNAP
jgi:hypothetical protein